MGRQFIIGVLFLIIFFAGCADNSGTQVYVSIDGNDSNPGTKSRPVATIAAARDVLRGIDSRARAVVWIGQGVYDLSEPLVFDQRDSGVTYRAVEGQDVRLLGGRKINAEDFNKISDEATLARIDESLRDKILSLDLKALGIKHRQRYPDNFTDNGSLLELYVNNERMGLSRYPNDGYMTIKTVLVAGGGNPDRNWKQWYSNQDTAPALPKAPGVFVYRDDRHEKWVDLVDRGLWFKGYWRTVWQNEAVRVGKIDTEARTVTLAVPVAAGIGSKYKRPEGSGKEPYWLMNLLEEIDASGEWAVDFVDEKLYFYPKADLKDASIVIADMAEPVVWLKDASDIKLQGLTVEGGLGDGIVVKGGSGNVIAGCTVRNMTKYAVRFDGGSENIVLSSDLYALGAGGVWLGGGDESVTPRVKAGHRVVNNHIHHFGQIERVYAPGVNVGFTGGGGGGHHTAVGMYVANNLIHDTPHAGILFGSWDTVFEYNEIFRYCKVSNDMGGFYSYDKYPKCGGQIFRYNFIHSSPGGGDGIYFDCDHAQTQVYGNIVYLGSDSKKFGTAFLYKIGTEKNPRVINCWGNIAIGSNVGYRFVAAEGSKIENNIAVNCKRPFSWEKVKDHAEVPADPEEFAAVGNITYQTDPGFENIDEMDLRLKADSKVFADLPSFEQVDVDKIGLFIDEYRKELPTAEELGLGQVYRPGLHREILDRD